MSIPISKVQQFFEDFNERLPGIAKAFKDSSIEVKELVKEAERELNEISECDEVRRVNEVKISYKHLNSTIEAVYTYLDEVNNLFWKLQSDTAKVIEDVERRNLKSVTKLVLDINGTINNCIEKYTLLLERFDELARSCDRAERECWKLEKEAEGKQMRAQRVGGAVTIGVAAAGTAVSVLIGTFTAGIGFGIGLPLTVALTAATATAVGATTVFLSQKYGKAAESFRNLSRRFQRLQLDIIMTQERVKGIISPLENNSNLDEITITAADGEYLSLVQVLKTTMKESTTSYQITSGRNDAEKRRKSLRDNYNRIYKDQ